MRTRTVVGALLNFKDEWQAREASMHAEPHFKPPAHAVLYLKPANTWIGDGEVIVLPEDVTQVQVGCTLGVVMAASAARLTPEEALGFVAGYVPVNDVTVPHQAVLRPPIKQKCRDTFCPIGAMAPAAQVADPSSLEVRAWVNGELKSTHSLRDLVRPLPQLLVEVTEFMTLEAGDILLVGVPWAVPLAQAGDRVTVEIPGVGRVDNPIRAEGAAA